MLLVFRDVTNGHVFSWVCVYVWAEHEPKQKLLVSQSPSVFITINKSLSLTLSQLFSSFHTHTDSIYRQWPHRLENAAKCIMCYLSWYQTYQQLQGRTSATTSLCWNTERRSGSRKKKNTKNNKSMQSIAWYAWDDQNIYHTFNQHASTLTLKVPCRT